MVEILSQDATKKIPLKFLCVCTCRFISNEWDFGPMPMLPNDFGLYPTAESICPSCGLEVIGGFVCKPLVGSAQYNKWFK